MPNAASYSVAEVLRDGGHIEIRALRHDDREGLIAAIARTSNESLYHRFFGPKHFFSEKEISFFLDVDFVNHVALVAVADEDGRPAIVGGARYIVVGPAQAEVSFMVIDSYQGRGIGTLLLRHLAGIARGAGIKEFVAEVMPDNVSMLGVFRHSGMRESTKLQPGDVHVVLELN
ncbi:MAG TPA: GNAT family N-acetyltransferase [Xanthobacteraceae bacterium]|nr:GNAT family N-acetyltransferase [Xanthobacteraceae bacterium]